MTGLDTNVLLRYFLNDDPVQSPAARRLLDSLTPENPGWICVANLLEFEWVLRSRNRAPRSVIASALDGLLGHGNMIVEQENLVAEAVQLFRSGKADFADCLISAAARAAGCSEVMTFDQVVARDAGMKLLTETV